MKYVWMVLVLAGIVCVGCAGYFGFDYGKSKCQNAVSAETIQQNVKVQNVVEKNRQTALSSDVIDMHNWVLQNRARKN